ncbi:MAG: hypothetical protein KDC54_07660 [Lewinella sp.]|nr:hypothetical protein [Lewinella sp.]
MKKIVLFLLILLAATAFQPVAAQPPTIDISRANYSFGVERYGNGIQRFLIEGDMLQRRGQWEEAILAYSNAIAQWPYWAPVYVRRAMAYYRQGRTSEARHDLQMARRLSPLAVQLYAEQQAPARHDLLATIPHSSIVTEVAAERLAEIYAHKRAGTLGQALAAIDQLADQQLLTDEELALLRGNWAFLSQDPLTAIEYYDWALTRQPAPVFYHNRGLARMVSYNFTDGCADLETAHMLGHQSSEQYLVELCGH